MKKDDTDEKYYSQYPEAVFADKKPEKIDPTLTDIKDKHERATAKYWVDRVSKLGNHKSPFLDMPQEEIDAFTVRHRQWIEPWVKGKDILEIGCGYGRTMDMFVGAHTYVGVECVPELIEEANKKYKELFLSNRNYQRGVHQGDLSTLDFRLGGHFEFDICVAIAVISSVEPFFHDLKRRIGEVLRPGGVILWLEEDYHRIDFK